MSPSNPDDATVARPPAPSPRNGVLDARFTPGTLVAGRYRIVSLLGEGGMGEVYRADDVKLGQRVALKYVPARLASDPDALERLLQEVRIGRTISHPNVCRMYDIVEAEGHRFIAMEYVDGEDLASLLRRIGRLPAAKAVSIARDICAGLGAAHEKGVIHRDLKPANIMVDGRGSARITDFGLAVAGDLTSSSSDGAGTPAYMSPEQLGGGSVSTRSDIYALGLVLYETFTGKRLFDADTLEDLRRQHGMTKTRPSALASDVDPAVERLILRCLEEDPALRPPSLRAIIAALPGGDPLQAAIAAGETPSPQLVAAAGQTGDLSAGRAWIAVSVLVLATLASMWLSDRALVTGYINGLRSSDVLAERARSVIRTLGWTPGSDSASWYTGDRAYLLWIQRHNASPSRWETLGTAPPSPVTLEYRDRRGSLNARTSFDPSVTRNDPAPTQPGDTSVIVDHEGRLRVFWRVTEGTASGGAEAGWSGAFREAGLDPGRFRPATPSVAPAVGNDRRYAWTGSYAKHPEFPVRIDAASFGGKPVYFEVINPWEAAPPASTGSGFGSTVFAILVTIQIVAGAVIARRNTVRGRVDFRGAVRLGIALAVLSWLTHLLLTHHVTDVYSEYLQVIAGVGLSMYAGLYAGVVYAATEPYVRRRWPHALVGWSRLIAGRWRDPLVGREVLVGLAGGAVIIAITRAAWILAMFRGGGVPLNPLPNRMLNNALPSLYVLGHFIVQAAMYTLGTLIVVLLLRLLFRRTAVAICITIVVWGLLAIGPGGVLDFGVGVIFGSILMLLLFRFGALTMAAAVFSYFILRAAPLTMRLSEPSGRLALEVMLPIALIAAIAFYITLGGKPVFGAIGVEDDVAA